MKTSIRELRLHEKELRLRERELSLRHWQVRRDSRSKIAEGGFRSLFLMNGVGVLALGAFLSAAITEPEASDFLPFLLAGIACHGAGLVLASLLFWTRYMKCRLEDQRSDYVRSNPWWWITWLVSLASVLMFALGVAFVVYGGFTQLGDLDDDDSHGAHVNHA
jgi:hypothetical protein